MNILLVDLPFWLRASRHTLGGVSKAGPRPLLQKDDSSLPYQHRRLLLGAQIGRGSNYFWGDKRTCFQAGSLKLPDTLAGPLCPLRREVQRCPTPLGALKKQCFSQTPTWPSRNFPNPLIGRFLVFSDKRPCPPPPFAWL